MQRISKKRFFVSSLKVPSETKQWITFIKGKIGLRCMAVNVFSIKFSKVRKEHRLILKFIRKQFEKFSLKHLGKEILNRNVTTYCWKVNNLIKLVVFILKRFLPNKLQNCKLFKQTSRFLKLGRYDTLIVGNRTEYWILNSFLREIFRYFLHITVGCKTGNKLFFFSKIHWNNIIDEQFQILLNSTKIKKLHLKPSSMAILKNLPCVSFVPKVKKETEEYRLIIRFRQFSKNIKYAFQFLSNIALEKPYLLGFGLKGLFEFNNMFEQYSKCLKKNENLHFLKLDVKQCFDSINQQKLMQILEEVLVSSQEVEVLNFIRHHITNTFFKKESNGKEVFHLAKGISQGSLISTLLCNLYIGHFENTYLKPLLTSDCFCVRLVDDMLLISRSYADIEKVRSCINGPCLLQEYNLSMIESTNEHSKFLYYLGYRIHKRNLSITKYFDKGITPKAMKYKFTVNFRTCSFVQRTNSILAKVSSLYMNSMYYSHKINTKSAISHSIQQILKLLSIRLSRIVNVTGRKLSFGVRSTVQDAFIRSCTKYSIPRDIRRCFIANMKKIFDRYTMSI